MTHLIKTLGILMGTLAVALLPTSCSAPKQVVNPTPRNQSINLALTRQPAANKYVGLDYGIKLNVRDNRASRNILKQYDGSMLQKPIFTTNPEVAEFISESTRRYMRTLGFSLGVDEASDYFMVLNITEFNVSYLSGAGWSGTVQLNVEVYDARRTLVYPNVDVVGRANIEGTAANTEKATTALNQAYANALDDIDWNRIAYFLKKADTPKQEKNKMVEGQGNTSLESTIIRWYIDSTPKGADVSTRVVSSTPSVKNTNQNYVGSTPYETTEAFDIRGLTFNNSGDVQIEVTCEKPGYITQKKRFNLRQAIEQKEISTKFNLVKED